MNRRNFRALAHPSPLPLNATALLQLHHIKRETSRGAQQATWLFPRPGPRKCRYRLPASSTPRHRSMCGMCAVRPPIAAPCQRKPHSALCSHSALCVHTGGRELAASKIAERSFHLLGKAASHYSRPRSQCSPERSLWRQRAIRSWREYRAPSERTPWRLASADASRSPLPCTAHPTRRASQRGSSSGALVPAAQQARQGSCVVLRRLVAHAERQAPWRKRRSRWLATGQTRRRAATRCSSCWWQTGFLVWLSPHHAHR